MCVFCAAVPVVASLGAREQSRQAREAREAAEQGKPAPAKRLPAGWVTIVAVGVLITGSVIYHTHTLIPL